MGATGTKLDDSARVQEQTLACARGLLIELGASRGTGELAARGATAHLERDLGLGSLERVELLLRLERTCGTRLPDHVVAEADTVGDLIEALILQGRNGHAQELGGGAAADSIWSANAAQTAAPTAVRTDIEERIRGAATLTEILLLRGRGEPGRAHIHLYESDSQLRTITFGELYERAAVVAAELQRRGFEPGQTAAMMLPTCAEFFPTFAGILLAGGIPVPIYPPFRVDRISEYATRQAAILKNAEVRFLFTFRQAEGLARLLQPRVPTLRDVLNAERIAGGAPAPAADGSPGAWRPAENLTHSAREDEIAFLQYTSGSTGDPKGVILTHANLLANMRAIVDGASVKLDDVCVSWLPLYHDMGLIGAWFVPLFTGVPLVLMSPLAFLSRPERWLRAIHLHRATISPAPNFAYELCVRKIAERDLQGLDLSSWRMALNGAEPVRAETLERFAQRFAPYGFRREALMPVYGLAEASLAVSFPRLGAGYRVDRIERARFELKRRAVPAEQGDATALEFVGAGQPLSNMEIRIAGEDGRDAGQRQEGKLWFRSPSATSGYYRNAAATAAMTQGDGWLDSGDLAYVAEGELYITGRAKDMIIKAGRNIYPQEVEEAAGGVAGVRAGCVVAFGAPDARSGTERLVVAAEIRDVREAAKISAEISRAVSKSVGVPPDHVELLPMQSIPKTSSGKLRRGETRRLYLGGRLGKRPPPAWLQMARMGARGAAPRVWSALKRGTERLAEIAYGVYALATFVAVLVPLWIAVSLAPDRQRAARITRRGARLMLQLARVPVATVDAEILNAFAGSGPWVFTPNHSSYLDILITVAYLPAGTRFVAKKEVRDIPLVGRITAKSGQFAFERGDQDARIRQTEEVRGALENGESVAIYPEGTFTPYAGIRPFQLGAFKAAAEMQRPICPVAVRGARAILRDKTILPRRGNVCVTFGPLVRPAAAVGGAWQEIVRLRDATREIISQNSGEPLL
ncbi:MAG: AMP-binding protein [Candidatus Acidiferrales bacterium]